MQLKNISSIILLIFIVAGVVYLWNIQSNEEIIDEDSVVLLLKNAQVVAEIDEDISESEFIWNIGSEKEIKVYGYEFSEENILNGPANIFSYFEKNGFQSDGYNVSSGTLGSITGMVSGQVVCLIDVANQLDDNSMPVPSGAVNISVKCGETEELLDIEKAVEENILKIIAEKYKIDASHIDVAITDLDDEHLRGIFEVLEEDVILGEDEKEMDKVGIFLALKINSVWDMAFIGNGKYFCEDIIDFEFPENMIRDCIDKD